MNKNKEESPSACRVGGFFINNEYEKATISLFKRALFAQQHPVVIQLLALPS